MPTERFYRLSEEKKSAIREAAMQEFIRVPFEKVSINQIILSADISRGSFYTYFEDKKDVLCYIYQDTNERFQNVCKESVLNSNGNYWKMLEELLDYTMSYYEVNDLFEFARTVMLYANTNALASQHCLFQEDRNGDMESMEQWIYDHVDRTNMSIQTLEEFSQLTELGMSCIMMATIHYYKEPEAAEEIKKMFRKKLEILQRGVCKSCI